MNSTPKNQTQIPRLQINLDEILSTIALELARVRICDQCQASVPGLINDLAQLVDEITQLADELDRTRMDCANLRAAMRATLAGYADGEHDPLWYLRDELNAPQTADVASRRPA
jgi:hypothetical protein